MDLALTLGDLFFHRVPTTGGAQVREQPVYLLLVAPYRKSAAQHPIEDGEFDDLRLLVQAACRASERLDEPVESWDIPKQFRIGFMVGRFWFSISPTWAGRTCPPELRDHLRSSVGRQRLARLMTERALPAPFPTRYERLSED